CNEHRLTMRQRCELFIQVCRAVQHAHQKGIIHRDLKPSNVLVMKLDGRAMPKVIDFGIAKAIDHRLTEQTILTQDRQFVGTPQYMSPEQAALERMDIDTRSDIYALGVLLYELLTDVTPLGPETPVQIALLEMLRRIREDDPPNPSDRLSRLGEKGTTIAERRGLTPHSLDREIRGEVDWVVMKALEKDRTRRYETASEFAADIERILNHEPVVAGPPSRTYRFRKFVQRNRAAVISAAIIAFLLVAGVISSTTFAVGQARERRAADLARIESVRQAAIAQSVNAFLNDDLLSMASPIRGSRDITVREAIDKAAEVIEGRFPDEPLVEAEIRGTVGETYTRLGEYALAEPQLLVSLHLTRQELGFDAPRSLKRAKELAAVIRRQGRFAEAEDVARSALETVPLSETTTSTRDYPALLNGLGTILRRQDRFEEAEQLYMEALKVGREILDESDRDLRVYLGSLSIIQHQTGRLAEAEQSMREIVNLAERQAGSDHPDTLAAMHNLAITLAVKGDTSESIEMFEHVAARRKEVLGEDHPNRLSTLNDLSGMYQQAGRLEEAEAILMEVLDVRRRLLSERHPETLSTLSDLALLSTRQGKHDEALVLHLEALRLRREVLGRENTAVLDSLGKLGAAYFALERFVKAEETHHEAVELARKIMPAGHWHIGSHLVSWGESLIKLDRKSEAETALREAHKILVKALGAEHDLTRRAAKLLEDRNALPD
ncbi:MAG: tetratricopeptide repeat protein, partial [Planctomycetota bacterium]|nr:tetratricopeptide repeat protein [Planctomycetota bacterium]